MNLAPLVDLVGRRMGLDPASLGANVLAAEAAKHMGELALDDVAAYVACLGNDPRRMQELMERLVVRESWFFRGAELFAFLPTLLKTRGTLRALSLPCSTGEEPYSLALALLEAGLPVKNWQIDAIDLSSAALDKARRGVYRDFSFRSGTPDLRPKYFRRAGDEWELAPAVRGLVNFHAGNILDMAAGDGTYDLILCRNLLIYFTSEARERALANLEARLAPDGLLALGHAEPQIVAGRAFERVGPEACFLFRRQTVLNRLPMPVAKPAGEWRPLAPAAPHRPTSAARSLPVAPEPLASEPLAPEPLAPEPLAPESVAPESVASETPLERVLRLADANRLDEALVECRAQLDHAGPSADAYSLLGIVQQARGDVEEAAQAFRKALYLDPVHAEALRHASLLAERRGYAVQAAALRERLVRADARGDL